MDNLKDSFYGGRKKSSFYFTIKDMDVYCELVARKEDSCKRLTGGWGFTEYHCVLYLYCKVWY